MSQQDDTTIELISQSRQISDLQAELAARDAEIERLKAELAAVPKDALKFYWDVTEYSQETVNYDLGDLGEMERAVEQYLSLLGHDTNAKFRNANTLAETRSDIAAVRAENERLRAELAAVPKAELWWHWNATEFTQAIVNETERGIAEKTRTIQRWFAAMDYNDDD